MDISRNKFNDPHTHTHRYSGQQRQRLIFVPKYFIDSIDCCWPSSYQCLIVLYMQESILRLIYSIFVLLFLNWNGQKKSPCFLFLLLWNSVVNRFVFCFVFGCPSTKLTRQTPKWHRLNWLIWGITGETGEKTEEKSAKKNWVFFWEFFQKEKKSFQQQQQQEKTLSKKIFMIHSDSKQ